MSRYVNHPRWSRRQFLRTSALAGVGITGLVLVGCGDDDDNAPPDTTTPDPAPASPDAANGGEGPLPDTDNAADEAPTSVAIRLEDFAVSADPARDVAAGPVAFAIENVGPSAHNLQILRTELALDALPLSEDGTQVDVQGAGLVLVDGVDALAAGETEELVVALEAGRYALICNMPGHYALGMVQEFVVAPA